MPASTASRAADPEFAPVQGHGPTVGGNSAGEHLDERALTGAVFPDQAVDLSEGTLQRGPSKGTYTAVGLDDPQHLEP